MNRNTNRNSGRIALATLAALFTLLAVFAAACFLDNVSVVVRWWRAFLRGGDVAAVRGLLPALDWACVDHSTATTLIPLLGLAAAARSLWRALRGRPCDAADFPFFAGSDRLFVALGLFGTLWGIIVIGYHDLETVTMADLMHCLHTALFSTLMAVVWVHVVDRSLLRPWLSAFAVRRGARFAGDDGLEAAVGRLVARLDAAAAAFDRRQREFEAAFAARQRRVDAAIDRRIARGERFFADRAAAELAAWERRRLRYEREFAAREREYAELFMRRAAELEKRAAESDAAALAAKRKLSGAARALAGLERLP